MFLGEWFRLHQIATAGATFNGGKLTRTFQLHYGQIIADLMLYKEDDETKVSRVCASD